MKRNCWRHKWFVNKVSDAWAQISLDCRHVRGEDGQGTVEFAIVTSAVLAIVIALGVFLNATDQGILVRHAISSASHNLAGAMLGIVGDIFSV